MSIPRGYVPNHKFWDRMGRVTPNVEWSESHRPHFESFAAPWLPTQRYDKEYEYYITVSAGKVVAEDRRGHIVPAGLRKAWNVGSGDVLTYSQTDQDEMVTDVTTGITCVAGAAYTKAELTTALKARGLIKPSEQAMDFISKPIGISSYNYWKASGPDHYNPAELYQHNFRPQALVAITCDYVATYPVLPIVASAESMANDNTGGADGALQTAIVNATRTVGWYDSKQLENTTKYADVTDGDDVVCYLMGTFPVAANTTETTMDGSADLVALMVNEVATVASVTAAGDYFIDYDLGILFLYEAGGDAVPATLTAGTSSFTYYNYGSVVSSGATLSSFACATGDLEYGDFLTYDINSNLIKAELDLEVAEGYTKSSGVTYAADPDYSGTDAIISDQLEQGISNYMTGIVGQIIGVTEFPRDYMDRVRTAYAGQTAANMRTPGSATGGRTDQLTYSNSADKMIIVNLILR